MRRFERRVVRSVLAGAQSGGSTDIAVYAIDHLPTPTVEESLEGPSAPKGNAAALELRLAGR